MSEPTENKTTPVTIGGRFLIDLSHGAYTSVATALKEYISNGWDAGALEITVRIFNPDDINDTVIEILDDGCGMGHDDLENKFFRVGRDRRREEGNWVKTINGKRIIHGRKGLGKLAGLKLANSLFVVSWTKTSLDGAHLNLKEIEQNPNEKPLIHWDESMVKPRGAKEHGTLIHLEDYSRNKTIDMEELRKLLSLWFEFGSKATVTLEKREGTKESSKLIKKWNIARSEIFKTLKTEKSVLEIKWDENGKPHSEKVTVGWGVLDKSDTTVKSMISVFSGTRALSTQEDFDIQKGWTNMFGIYKLVAEFHADWLDKMEDLDPADIKREGINWDLHPALQKFKEIGAQWVKDTCASMAKTDTGKSEIKEETKKLVDKNMRFNRWPETQRVRLIDMVSSFASREGISTKDLDRFVDLFAFVLENGALIQFLQSLKESGKKNIEGFIEFASDFTAIEITGLLEVTKSKLDLVTELSRLITSKETLEVPRPGKEDITTFLAKNPWIFDPELRIDHKNVTIKRIVLETEGFDTSEINKLPMEYFKIRPDFVGYLGPSNVAICIELKKPTLDMSEKEAQSVIKYRAALMKCGKYDKLKFIVVSGSFSKQAETLLNSLDNIEMMHYVKLLERGKNQLSEFISKLESGLEGLYPKNK
jgi:hypothetical protein